MQGLGLRKFHTVLYVYTSNWYVCRVPIRSLEIKEHIPKKCIFSTFQYFNLYIDSISNIILLSYSYTYGNQAMLYIHSPHQD